MKQLIVRNIIEPNGSKKGRCLACGATLNTARRKYCSMECRKRLHYKLEVRTGLIRALNAKYATFYFSEVMIIMDMLPYGSEQIFSFFYPRSPGSKPAEDFSRMADMLGNIWWNERKRTNKRYLASFHLLGKAQSLSGSDQVKHLICRKLCSIKTYFPALEHCFRYQNGCSKDREVIILSPTAGQ